MESGGESSDEEGMGGVDRGGGAQVGKQYLRWPIKKTVSQVDFSHLTVKQYLGKQSSSEPKLLFPLLF